MLSSWVLSMSTRDGKATRALRASCAVRHMCIGVLGGRTTAIAAEGGYLGDLGVEPPAKKVGLKVSAKMGFLCMYRVSMVLFTRV